MSKQSLLSARTQATVPCGPNLVSRNGRGWNILNSLYNMASLPFTGVGQCLLLVKPGPARLNSFMTMSIGQQDNAVTIYKIPATICDSIGAGLREEERGTENRRQSAQLMYDHSKLPLIWRSRNNAVLQKSPEEKKNCFLGKQYCQKSFLKVHVTS